MKRFVAALFAMLVLLASPAMAAEQVETLPTITSFDSARMDFAFAIDADVQLYAKAEYAGDSLHAVAVDVLGQQVIEIIVIGNRVYLRENNNTRWQATTVQIEDPGDVGVPVDIDLDELEEAVTLYNLGTVDVRGNPTTQYQAQIDPVALGAPNNVDYAFNLNIFVGSNDAYPHKFQATLQDMLGSGQKVLLQVPLDIYDFNQPILIGAPDPSLVDEVASLAVFERTDLPGTELLPFWMRPMQEWSFQAKGHIK